MNGSFYSNPTFPGAGNPQSNTYISPPGNISANPLTLEQSLIENILRLNKGKRVRVFASYPDSTEWRDKIYTGTIEEAGRDHLLLSDSQTGNWWLIRMLYVNYVEFDEPINYNVDYSDTFD